jgi:hypothetical protein
MKKITLGAVVAVVALWGGCYLHAFLGAGHWAVAPTILTATVAFWGGIVAVVMGCMDLP